MYGGGRRRPAAHRRITDDPGSYPPKMLQEIMGHASITTTRDLHLYPGEMDRYADRLDDAAGITDAVKMRPDGEHGSSRSFR